MCYVLEGKHLLGGGRMQQGFMVRRHVTVAGLYISRCTRILFFLFLGSFLGSSQMYRIDSNYSPLQYKVK